MGSILSIDIGEKVIGFAEASVQNLAVGFAPNLLPSHQTPQHVHGICKLVEQIVRKRQRSLVVLGIPKAPFLHAKGQIFSKQQMVDAKQKRRKVKAIAMRIKKWLEKKKTEEAQLGKESHISDGERVQSKDEKRGYVNEDLIGRSFLSDLEVVLYDETLSTYSAGMNFPEEMLGKKWQTKAMKKSLKNMRRKENAVKDLKLTGTASNIDSYSAAEILIGYYFDEIESHKTSKMI